MIKAVRYLVAAFALAFAVTAFAEIQEEEGVLVLTDANFESALAQHELILVEFYAPWCGHCKKLAPEYAKAAAALKKQEIGVALAKVDATEQKELAEKFEVRGFPTIKFFRNGIASEYNGGRTDTEIVAWLKKKSGPAARTLTNEAELQAFLESSEVNVIGFVNNVDGAAAKTFLAAAAADDALAFAITTSAELRAKYDIAAGSETIVLSKPFDEKRHDLTLTAETTAADITSFLSANARPLVQFFTKESAQQIFSSPIQVHVLFFTNSEAEYHENYVNVFTEAAKSFRGRALAVNIPHSETRILDFFGVVEADLPVAFIADMRSGNAMKKFKIEGALSSANAIDYVEKFFTGQLKPSLKSEAPSDEDTAGNVKVVKGSTFQSIVVDNNKDVFVEFYAPWCGHCKKLAPIWDQLGDKFAASNVVIAKVDATTNEIDYAGVEVQGFPTLYFFKAGDKANPVKYEGERELDALTDYLKQNAANAATSDEL